MNINQAFTILKNAGGIRAARIITEKRKKISFWRALYYAHLLKIGMPVAKIIHSRWFYGLEFYTNRHTLDPRPDTETLVESVIKDCIENRPRTILDMGTGTGCIICALCKNIQNSTGVAMDKSVKALKVARKNIKKLHLDNQIKTCHADFENFKSNEKFDIIVSNPPYIKYGDIRVNEGAKFDPKIALYAANDGFAAYEAIAKNAKNLLNKDGKIYLEIGIGQSNQIIKIFEFFGWHFDRIEKDLSGINRVVVFKH
ncbi:MAG: peptide chain release factor N(5)-glutamine methyltransferase [Alphaproteobacteria bacterium]|nr:peptide chain release factor N(5)-glutamine methyltransferase [Alphaproteobacteria bacterium]